jgi:hypothetical protein
MLFLYSPTVWKHFNNLENNKTYFFIDLQSENVLFWKQQHMEKSVFSTKWVCFFLEMLFKNTYDI